MRRLSRYLVLFFCASSGVVVLNWPGADAQVPTITISTPADGSTFDTAGSVVTVTGTVLNPGDGFASLINNGNFVQNIALDTSTSPASFSNPLVLSSGQNIISISDTNGSGSSATSVTVTSTRSRNQIRVNLVWDNRTNDVDLYLFVPAATPLAIWYGSRTGGGGALDVDDVNGLGPENISFPNGTDPPGGRYVGAINLFRSDGAPVTNARATVFLNEGTSSERVFTFDTVSLTVGNSGADVFNGTNVPREINSTSTIFFSFDYNAPQTTRTERVLATVVSYPNPAVGPGATITFSATSTVSDTSNASGIIRKVRVFDPSGREIRSLTGDGTSKLVWNTRNIAGANVASGVYMYIVEFTDGQVGRGRFTIVR